MRQAALALVLCLVSLGGCLAAQEPAAVVVSSSLQLRQAVAEAKAGDRILVAPGEYEGGLFFKRLRGEPDRPIVIAAQDPAKPPVIRGGGNGMQLAGPAYVELRDLHFVGARNNGLSIDDAGDYAHPAHHIVLAGLHVSEVGPEGNCDGIKLSGVADFGVRDCTIVRWGSGGSGIDMVGCHRGVIEGNVFRARVETTSEGVQAKGGTSEIVIGRNRFEHAGGRGVNIGGSTGLEFFRPPLRPGEEHWEAKAIRVEGNFFIGGQAAVAFVGQEDCVVRFNTIYRPRRWALRILQETMAPGFVPSRRGEFSDNIVVFRSDEWGEGGVNIGPHTAPETFRFARNLWYCLDRPDQSRPRLPATEEGGVYGVDPMLRDPERGDLSLRPGSSATGRGAEALAEE